MKHSFMRTPEQALNAYRDAGYFVEEDILSHELCDELIASGMRLPGVLAGDFTPAMQPHRADPAFLKAMRLPAVVAIINRLVGGKAVGLQTEFFYARPSVRGFAGHQDNFFVEAPADAFASAWMALVDVTPENGGLFGYPGSHNEGRLPVRDISAGKVEHQDPNANNEESILPAGYQAIDISAPKGSVVFLHSHFVHGSNRNRSEHNRFALLCTYIREGASFRAGRYARREPVPL